MSRRKALQNLFRQSFESWVAGLRPACFLVTFCTMQKVTPRSPSQEASRFCKPRTSTPQPQLPTATIKTFFGLIRGFANLDSAHSNNHFAQSNEILCRFAAFYAAFGGRPVGAARPACNEIPAGSFEILRTSSLTGKEIRQALPRRI